ncbi:MAG: chemotaxis protein [Planctomycetia bacterium]|nr:chemotaxis protein [Planctomycetia bacterium]
MSLPPDITATSTTDRRFFAEAIGMGELGVGQTDGLLKTFVGSCVGVTIFNRRRKLAGLAHVMLPESRGQSSQPGKFADTAIPEMLRRLEKFCGGETVRWSAKIAGGAKMFAFQADTTVGDLNVAAIEHILAELDIPILAKCCGGKQGRRIAVDVATGTMTVETIGAEPQRF